MGKLGKDHGIGRAGQVGWVNDELSRINQEWAIAAV
jgi:hypothetical protein